MKHITFVKKILANGDPCKKCQEVAQRLIEDGLIDSINHIAIADERDADSEGMRMAAKYQVQRAPFFLVEENNQVEVFDVYFKLRKELAEDGIGKLTTSAL
jgi:hypothetical protein